MKFNTVFISKIAGIIRTQIKSNNTLFYDLIEDIGVFPLESVLFAGVVLQKIHNHQVYFKDTYNQDGYFNSKKLYSSGQNVLVQKTWKGNLSKSSKYSEELNFIGRYVILTTKPIQSPPPQFIQHFTPPLGFNLLLRSRSNMDDLVKIEQELIQLSKRIAQLKALKSTEVLLGKYYYHIALRELDFANLAIITNDEAIFDELKIHYSCVLNPSLVLDEINPEQLVLNNQYNSRLNFHTVSGINIIDVDSYQSKLKLETLAYLLIEDIHRLICLQNLVGIILIDYFKGISPDMQHKIIDKYKRLFSNDIVNVKILGFSKAGLLEIVRNKF